MKKGFLAGFAVSLAVVLLPLFYYMDARSSSGNQASTASSIDSLDLPPDSRSGNPPGVGSSRLSADSSSTTLPPPATPEAPREAKPSIQEEGHPGEIVMLKNPMPVRPAAVPLSARPHGGIRTRVYDPDRIYTLRTAVSHVTLVDLPEDAKEVYMGDSKLFLAEVFGKRVKIKPITYNPDARTNMIIYTLNKRLTFRIVMVPPGEEDDLVTFLLPREETVVNLNPLKTEIRQSLEAGETKRIASDRLQSLEDAGPTDPFRIDGEGRTVSLRFLGFTGSRKDQRFFGLFEVRNAGRKAFRVDRIRIRRYRTSILWEGEKRWDGSADWETTFNREIPPGKTRRFLLPVRRIPSFGGRTGIAIEMDGQDGETGPETVLGDSGGEGH